MPRPVTVDEFWSRHIVTPDGCWEWTGTPRADGYGQITMKRQKWLAHRLSYTLAVGPIAPGLQIDHLCRNRGCINPDHLEAVTPLVNNMRSESLAARRARMTHCPRGHEFTPDNIYARPDRERSRMCRTCCQIREARRERRSA